MNKHVVPMPPITEVDLALFSEGLLTSQRAAQVRQFLLDHPELRDFASLDESSEDATTATTGSVQQTSATLDSSAQAPITSASATMVKDINVAAPSAATQSSFRGFRKRLPSFNRVVAIASVAMSLLVMTAFWRAANAVELTLSQTEYILRTDQSASSNYLDLAPQVLNSRIALEQLEHSFWLSQRNGLRRDRLLAAIYVTQARLEQIHFSQLNYTERPMDFPPLQLCNRAIELLQPQRSDLEARQIMADAYQLKGQTQYLFGTMLRSANKLAQGVNQKSLAADSLLAAIETLPPAKRGSAQYLQLAGLLHKSMHKGSLNGKLSDVTGTELPASSILLPRLYEQFPTLIHASLSLDEKKQHLNEITDDFGAWLMQQPVSDFAQAIAMMNICNSHGLRMTNGRGTLEQAVTSLGMGIELAETIPSAEQSVEYWMTYGRLLGNMADAFEYFDQLEEEIEWRPKAISIFRKISIQQRTEESFLELGWVTARQLIAEYRMHARHPDQPSNVAELLGALRQISNNGESLNGYQLGGMDDELIFAILAEASGDASLGDGAAAILQLAKDTKKNPPAINQQVRLLLEDFRGNAYLRQHPEFQEALKIFQIEPAP